MNRNTFTRWMMTGLVALMLALPLVGSPSALPTSRRDPAPAATSLNRSASSIPGPSLDDCTGGQGSSGGGCGGG